MVRQFTDHPNDYDIWAHYDAIGIPVLCLRGAESDLVLRDATDEMMRRGPGTRGLARIIEVPGCGHAPALNVPEQLDLVKSFIDEHDVPVITPAAAIP
jgi:pimeloyl-ACP methyl ester carboxylesterase